MRMSKRRGTALGRRTLFQERTHDLQMFHVSDRQMFHASDSGALNRTAIAGKRRTWVMALPLLPPTKLPTAFVSILPALAREEEGAAGVFESRRKLEAGQALHRARRQQRSQKKRILKKERQCEG